MATNDIIIGQLWATRNRQSVAAGRRLRLRITAFWPDSNMVQLTNEDTGRRSYVKPSHLIERFRMVEQTTSELHAFYTRGDRLREDLEALDIITEYNNPNDGWDYDNGSLSVDYEKLADYIAEKAATLDEARLLRALDAHIVKGIHTAKCASTIAKDYANG